MTSFVAGDPGTSGGDNGATSFVAPGVVQADTVTSTPQDDEVVLELDGRKYTRYDLRTKITNADSHIAQLTEERKQDKVLLERVTKALEGQSSVKSVLENLKPGEVVAPAAAAVAASAPAAAQHLTQEQVQQTVQSTLAAEAARKKSNDNWTLVTTTLTKAYGAKTQEMVAKAAKDQGITLELAAQMARSTPGIFLKLFDLEQKPTTPHLRGDVNAGAFNYTPPPAPGAKSGFWDTKTTRDQTASYRQALAAKLASLGY